MLIMQASIHITSNAEALPLADHPISELGIVSPALGKVLVPFLPEYPVAKNPRNELPREAYIRLRITFLLWPL